MDQINYSQYRTYHLSTPDGLITNDNKILNMSRFFELDKNNQLRGVQYIASINELDCFINIISTLENFDLAYDDYVLLKIASANNAYDILRYLIQNSVDVTACNNVAIKIVIWNTCCFSIDIIERMLVMLIENGADIHVDNDFLLQQSIKNQKLETIKILVQYGANIHTNNLLRIVYEHIDQNILQYLIDSGMPIDPISLPDIIKKCIYKNSQVFQNNRYRGIIKILLPYCIDYSDIFHPNVLINAIKSGSFKLVKLLTDYGADFSTLNTVPIRNNDKMSNFLLTNGLDPLQLTVILSKPLNYNGSYDYLND